MDIAGLTEEELKSSLPGLKPENIFVTKLDPEKSLPMVRIKLLPI